MRVSARVLASLLPTLDGSQFSVLLRSVLDLRTPEQQADVGLVDRLKAGLWEFMTAVGFVTDAQARHVLKRVEPVLMDVTPLFVAGGKKLPVCRVTFASSRYVCHPLADKWYDMVYDEELDELPEPAVLLVTCDVTAMYVRQARQLAELERKDADAAKLRGLGGEPGVAGAAPAA